LLPSEVDATDNTDGFAAIRAMDRNLFSRLPYVRWQRTYGRLAIRWRKPYMAGHTSVSWNLMLGRKP
jgi:hypothetical protein